MRKLSYLSAIAGIMLLWSCSLNNMIKLAEQQDLTVTPKPLEVHADSVKFEMSAVLPVKMLPSGKLYTVNTFYKYGGQEKALEGIEFNADDFPNSDNQQPRVTKEYQWAYDPAMKSGDLEIQGVALDPKNGKTKSTARLKVADGVITTSQLVQEVYYAAYADHGYDNSEQLTPSSVDFFFLQGRHDLRNSEKRSERGSNLRNYIAEKNATRSVTVTGTHSPEGSERINTDLAANRAKRIEGYYSQQMKRYDYKGMADSIKFILKDIVEDWALFKDKLSAYDGIDQEQKNEMLQIVNAPGEFETKEKQLQKTSGYKTIFKDIYPELRRSRTEILTLKDKLQDATIAILAKQIGDGSVSADTLSDEELAFGATLTPSLKEKEAIYTAAAKKNDHWAASNNLGAVYLEMAAESSDQSDVNSYVEKALAQLEISAKKNESAEAQINMASAYTMQGNDAKALEAIRAAASKGAPSEHVQGMNKVKGSLEIKAADYANAVRSTSSGDDSADNLFNKGLSQLLNKDFQSALTSFDQAMDKDADYALAYYCAAVASARLNKGDDVVSHLKMAVDKDPALKNEALNDLEFAKFSGSVQQALQ